MQLSESQWQKIDVASRIILSLTIIAGISFALDTGSKIMEFQNQVENGNCSYLVDTGYIETKEAPLIQAGRTNTSIKLPLDKDKRSDSSLGR